MKLTSSILALAATALLATAALAEAPHDSFLVKPETIKARLTTMFLHGSYTIAKDSPTTVSFDRPMQGFRASFLYGSNFNGTPNERHTFTFVPTLKGTEVYETIQIVTNPGSGFEQTTDATERYSKGEQDTLDLLKNQLDHVKEAGLIE